VMRYLVKLFGLLALTLLSIFVSLAPLAAQEAPPPPPPPEVVVVVVDPLLLEEKLPPPPPPPDGAPTPARELSTEDSCGAVLRLR